MRRALLLYNPAAGPRQEDRARVVATVAEALRGKGVEVETAATEGPGSAGRQAAESTADVVFACGGDGTVHEVMQGLVGAKPALGIVPLGTANALARDLRLPLDPVAAALRQLGYQPRPVPVGRVEWTNASGEDGSRYFAVMAGAGPHAALVYRAVGGGHIEKARLGRIAYYARAAALFFRQAVPAGPRASGFPTFTVEFFGAEGKGNGKAEKQILYGNDSKRDRDNKKDDGKNRTGGLLRRMEAVSAIGVRVSSLGGLFHPLARGGAVDSTTLRLVVVRPPGNLALPLWFGMSWLGLSRWNRYVESFDVTEFRCRAAEGVNAPDLQADGEWLGRAGARVSLIHGALRLLMAPRT